ncbi:glycosyltransferase family 2 protein [Dactylosporangium sp. CS-033363]|uniref:glycosyltransferase family 2 protein n=1 Tax=Dactylosporangium sp. CS-033363 TaxID=3239935 RepID=UPI003D8A519E
MPDVTVVVPTHDRPGDLERAVASVRRQTVPPVAIVVVDDTGSAEEAAGRLGVRYVRVASHTAGASRNRGALHADTSHLAFLDDDDEWAPTFLERLLAAGGDLAAAWTWYQRGEQRRPGCTLPRRLRAADCLHHNPGLTGSNFVVRTAAFRALRGFDPLLIVNNDLDLLVRALDAGLHHVVVPERLVIQHSRGHGHLSSRGPHRASGLALYRDKYRDRLTLAQRRFLARERYVALKFPGQRPARRAAFALLGWLNASPRQLAELALHRTAPFYD